MTTSDHDHLERRIAQAIAAGLRLAAEVIEDAVAEIDASSSEPAPALRAAASDAAEALARLEPADAEGTALASAPVEAASEPPKLGPASISPERLRHITVGGLSPSEFRRVAAMDDDEFAAAQRAGFANYLRGVTVDESVQVPANSSAVARPVSAITPTSAQVGVGRFSQLVRALNTMEAAE